MRLSMVVTVGTASMSASSTLCSACTKIDRSKSPRAVENSRSSARLVMLASALPTADTWFPPKSMTTSVGSNSSTSPVVGSMPTVRGSSSSLSATGRSMSSGLRSFGTLARFGFSPSTGGSCSTYGPYGPTFSRTRRPFAGSTPSSFPSPARSGFTKSGMRSCPKASRSESCVKTAKWGQGLFSKARTFLASALSCRR